LRIAPDLARRLRPERPHAVVLHFFAKFAIFTLANHIFALPLWQSLLFFGVPWAAWDLWLYDWPSEFAAAWQKVLDAARDAKGRQA
jgi:hypothetical protein